MRCCGLAVIAILVPAITSVPCASAELTMLPQLAGKWYLGGEGGWTNLQNQQDSIAGIAFPQFWRNGFNLGVRAGYAWGPWRLEEEFRYQDNDSDRLARHPASDGRGAYAMLTNILYDFQLGGPVSPHIGGGVGAVDLHESVSVPAIGVGEVFPGDDWVFGYQAIAGVRYRVNEWIDIDLDYRYLATRGAGFTTPPQLVVDGVPRGDQAATSGYETHSVVVSVSLRFGGLPR